MQGTFCVDFCMFYCLYCFCVVYIENNEPFPLSFTNLNSSFPRGKKIRKCHGVFTKIVMESLGIRGNFFQNPEHPVLKWLCWQMCKIIFGKSINAENCCKYSAWRG